MSEPTLTDRYIAAVTRAVPEEQRDDVAAELHAAIADQHEARVAEGEDPAAAERVVLNDLGDPDRLAAGYADRPLTLIGPKYFLDWRRLLTLLLWIVVPLASFGIGLGQALDGAPLIDAFASVLAGALSVAVHLAFWVTLVFAVIERTGRRAPLAEWTVDALPRPRQQGAGVGETVASVVAIFAAGAALVWDQTIGFVPGASVTFFDPGLWPVGIAYALLILAVDAVVAVIVHVVGRWTLPLAVVDALFALALALPALWLLFEGALLNPAFFPTVLPTGGEDVAGVLAVVIGFVIAGTTIWEIIDTFRKALAAR